MKGSVEKRALAGALSGTAGFGVTLLQSLVAVPILLSLWGQENYGIWLAFTAATTLLATIDLGHQNYLGNAFNQDLPKGENILKARLASGLRAALLLGGIQVVIAVILLSSGSLGWLIGISNQQIADQHLDIAFLSIVVNWAVFGSVAGILGRIYPPYGFYAEAQWIGIFQRLTQFLMVVGIAAAGGFILGYSVGMWVFCVVFSCVWFPLIYRKFPSLFPWWRGGSWRLAWENLSRSAVLTANGVIAQFSLSGLSLIIAAKFDASAVPLFTTLRTVANTFSQASMVLTNPLLPDLVRLHVQGETEKLRQAFRACWFTGGLVINLGLVVVVPFIPWLYEQWTRGRLEFSPVLFALLAWSVAIRSAYAPLAAYVNGLNKLKAQFVINTTQTVVTLLIPLALGAMFGLTAFGLGVVAGELIAAVGYTWYAASEMGHAFRSFSGLFAINSVLPVSLVAIAFALGLLGWPTAIVSAAIVSVILLVIYFYQWRSLPEALRQRFKRLLPGT